MSNNDLVLFKTTGPSQAFGLDPNEESLSEGIGASYGVIGYKGKNWSLKYRGQTMLFTRPDGTPNPWLHVIILGQAKVKSRSYYEKWEDGNTDPPKCSSSDGVAPDVADPIAQACAVCPMNTLVMNPQTGKRTTPCREHKRLAVLLLPAESEKLLGEALLEPVFLRVPAASLQGLAMMGDQMKALNYHFSTFVTRVEFDTKESYPRMIFKAIQALPDDYAPLIKELRESPTIARIISGGGFARPALGAPDQVQQLGFQQGSTIDTGFDKVVKPQQKAAPQTLDLKANPAGADPGIDLGLRAAGQPTQQTTQAAPQNAADMEDTGPPSAATDAMNARIAALMPPD